MFYFLDKFFHYELFLFLLDSIDFFSFNSFSSMLLFIISIFLFLFCFELINNEEIIFLYCVLFSKGIY